MSWWAPRVSDATKTGDSSQKKKLALNIVALIVGLLLAWTASLRVLAPLGIDQKETVDIVVIGLVVSGGTEGVNSIMKFLGYKKEEKKEGSKVKAGTTDAPPAG